MSTAVQTQEQGQETDWGLLEKLVIGGDVSVLSEKDRWAYYKGLCERWGLDAMSQPLQYLPLGQKDGSGGKKLVLYVTSGATAQIAANKHVSRRIISKGRDGDIYVVVTEASTPDGRVTQVVGALPLVTPEKIWQEPSRPGGKGFMKLTGNLIELQGDDLANAVMKCATKSDRRAVLGHVGLSMFMDESEISSVPNAGPPLIQETPQKTLQLNARNVDTVTGEIPATAEKPPESWQLEKIKGYAPAMLAFFGRKIKLAPATFAKAEEQVVALDAALEAGPPSGHTPATGGQWQLTMEAASDAKERGREFEIPEEGCSVAELYAAYRKLTHGGLTDAEFMGTDTDASLEGIGV